MRLFPAKTAGNRQKSNKTEGDNAKIALEWLFFELKSDSAINQALIRPSLAFKGFTTITNSGSEVIDPKRNVGRAIIISIAACVVIYTLVGFAVASNLSLAEIIETQDYSLAAARPALGEYAVWFTVAIAMMATAGGILASILRCPGCWRC